jgi:hypothetical protein
MPKYRGEEADRDWMTAHSEVVRFAVQRERETDSLRSIDQFTLQA